MKIKAKRYPRFNMEWELGTLRGAGLGCLRQVARIWGDAETCSGWAPWWAGGWARTTSPVSVFSESLVVLQLCQWLTPGFSMILSIAKPLYSLKGTNHTWWMFSGKQLFLTLHFPAKSTSQPPLHTRVHAISFHHVWNEACPTWSQVSTSAVCLGEYI